MWSLGIVPKRCLFGGLQEGSTPGKNDVGLISFWFQGPWPVPFDVCVYVFVFF